LFLWVAVFGTESYACPSLDSLTTGVKLERHIQSKSSGTKSGFILGFPCPLRIRDAFMVIRRPSLEMGRCNYLFTLSPEPCPCMYTVSWLATRPLARVTTLFLLADKMRGYSNWDIKLGLHGSWVNPTQRKHPYGSLAQNYSKREAKKTIYALWTWLFFKVRFSPWCD